MLTVATTVATFVLPPTRALWIPAELPHETISDGNATMRSLYIRPDRCPIRWEAPTPVLARALLAELVTYLENDDLDGQLRAHAEAVLVDLLRPVPMATIDIRLPTDERAREVADALARNPAANARSRSGATT